ncbi:MAG TPA: 23S rRNA (guanosine(2251)-2'-O)-methyltransferase RlmB [Gammaproteobacteria bacterium]|nr:23S rRNA (guanosine(2251)-2'-O)-methyltransferase RlmB [Gammaproteobacteria bacterium]
MSALSWAGGVHAVEALLRRPDRPVQRLLLQAEAGPRLAALVELAQQQGLVPLPVERDELDRLVPGLRHQGVAAGFVPAAPGNERELLAALERLAEPALLLVLDQVQDPQNLGACLRTAAAVGAHGVVVPRHEAVGLTPAVRKAASGGAELVPLYRVSNLGRALRGLREAGIWLAGTAADAGQALYSLDARMPIAFVLGNEGRGLRRLTGELCDFRIQIPIVPAMESLNVSVAAGVCLFEARRQRLQVA